MKRPVRTARWVGILGLFALLGVPCVDGAGAPASMSRTAAHAGTPILVSDTSASLHCTEPEGRSFDFWIGEWDVLNRNRRPDGTVFHPTGRATDKVHAVVGGCAIVEHWRGDAIGSYILGFSIRSYDPREDEWTIVLLWPTNGSPSFGELTGGFRKGRGEFSFQRLSAEGDTVTNRFVFSDIGPQSLRWENGTSRDGGQSWVGHWIMEFTRRPETAPALLNGPTMTVRRCPGEPHRRFDPALGEWQGTRATPAGDTLTVRTHLVRILEGCAVVERTRALDGSWESYRVRAWEPDSGRWVEYAIDSERRALLRRQTDGESLTFLEVDGIDGSTRRVRWEPGADGAPGWVEEESERPDAPWRTHSVLRFDRPLGAL